MKKLISTHANSWTHSILVIVTAYCPCYLKKYEYETNPWISNDYLHTKHPHSLCTSGLRICIVLLSWQYSSMLLTWRAFSLTVINFDLFYSLAFKPTLSLRLQIRNNLWHMSFVKSQHFFHFSVRNASYLCYTGRKTAYLTEQFIFNLFSLLLPFTTGMGETLFIQLLEKQ